jgi:D-alanyl-D-alanine carboxypeptidase (penicillin-binding protein 5/6)
MVNFRASRILRYFPHFLIAAAIALSSVGFERPAEAARKRKDGRPYLSALLIEAETGKVLRSFHPRERVIPASIAKMMTMLLTLESIEEKSITMKDIVTTSAKASRIGGQQVYLKEGERFPLEKLLEAVAISSANDAAYAVAEHVAGDTGIFVELMNERAKQLGMSDTRFVNVHGLPPGRRKPPNLMSARDVSILARELLKHPIVTKWGSTKRAPFRGGKFILTNTNRLVGKFRGLDGLKTGSYRRAGYSIVATAKRKNLRLIAVILGSDQSRKRFSEAKRLLSWGFARYRWYESKVDHPKNGYAVKVERGYKERIRLKPGGKFRTLMRRGQEKSISIREEIPASVPAPVQKGQKIGRVVFELYGKKMGEVRLAAAESVDRLGLFQTIIRLR